MKPPIIRRATDQDVDQLIAFNCAMAQETENIQLDPVIVEAGVKALFERPESGFYTVAESSSNQLAGSLMITSEWSDWRNGVFWWIQSVYVRPEYRRQGVYRSLYIHVQELAKKDSLACGFRLYVEKDNQRAQKTYESLGMSETPYLVYEQLNQDVRFTKE